ncbi:MAG: DUF2961 domain-containing protein [Planctomycetes bacterium]|nr:DUF2961 domain-containing protein [Planctomycetota bacterium]
MSTHHILDGLFRLGRGRTRRASSYDVTGRNADYWRIEAGETRVLAEIDGPGKITHLWMTQSGAEVYRDVLIRIYWDGEKDPSVLVPLGDFFGLGHCIVNSYQSLLFSASTARNNQFGAGCALNCYAPMPFNRSARIELVNEGQKAYGQYFYVDHELVDRPWEEVGYFHAQFRRENPFGGWAHEIRVNTPEANIVNLERLAWQNNYLILEARGRGHYLGCNLSVTNFQGTWWGEGDDMIWVDGYHWPPDLHGTGSEDYLNQAWGMQPNAFLRNGSSIHESATQGYQTSYVHHLENPVRFQKDVRVTIEHGHGNHLCNEMSSVAYWYQAEPHVPFGIAPVEKRKPVHRKNNGEWINPKSGQTRPKPVRVNAEMKAMKRQWAKKQK